MRIQRWTRAMQARKVLQQHFAARSIQKYWRGYVANVDFLVSVLSVIKIQACARTMVKVQSYHKAKEGFILLQSIWRGAKCKRLTEVMVHSVIRLQTWSRSIRAMNVFQKYRTAAVKIQSATRGKLARLEIEIQHYAASEIQRIWRGYQDNVDYIMKILASIKIQSLARQVATRKLVPMLKENAIYQKMKLYQRKCAARQIQDSFRRFLYQKKLLKVVITAQRFSRGFIARCLAVRMKRGIVNIQCRFRAQITRKTCSKRVRAALLRINEANQKALAEPNMRLSIRTSAALHSLQTSKRLAEIMKAIITLEVSTRLSVECCKAFALAKASNILYALVRTCNRSLPHIELLHFIILTLMNVARHAFLLNSIATKNSVEILLDLIQMFRDKESIFPIAVPLTERIVFSHKKFLVQCGSKENTKRLRGIIALCQRKKATSKRIPTQGRRPISGRKNSIVKANTPASIGINRSVEILENILRNTALLE